MSTFRIQISNVIYKRFLVCLLTTSKLDLSSATQNVLTIQGCQIGPKFRNLGIFKIGFRTFLLGVLNYFLLRFIIICRASLTQLTLSECEDFLHSNISTLTEYSGIFFGALPILYHVDINTLCKTI